VLLLLLLSTSHVAYVCGRAILFIFDARSEFDTNHNNIILNRRALGGTRLPKYLQSTYLYIYVYSHMSPGPFWFFFRKKQNIIQLKVIFS